MTPMVLPLSADVNRSTACGQRKKRSMDKNGGVFGMMLQRKRVGTIVVLLLFLFPAICCAAMPLRDGSTIVKTYQPRDLVMMIVYTLVALGFSFLCSVAEAVVLSVTPSYIAGLGESKTATQLKKMKHDIDRSLAAILTLNTIAHTVGAGGAGAKAAAYFGPAWVGVSMAVLTLLILFLSEIIPKTIGAVYWRRLAPAAGRFVQFLTLSLFPLIWVSELLTKMLTAGRSLHTFSREEFTALAEIGAQGGHIDDKESRILRNLFRFSELQVKDIMTPRTVMYSLQQDQSVHDLMEGDPNLTFSRIPIYNENRDDITGFVLKGDILLTEASHNKTALLKNLKLDIRTVLDSTPLDQALDILLENRAHILLAVDEYGGTQGLVTLEDVVETLIGFEIVDEADKDVDMRHAARKKWQQRMKRLGVSVEHPQSADDSDNEKPE